MTNKDKLVAVHNGLMQVETKGDSSIIMSECIKAVREIIDNYDEKGQEETQK